MIVYLDGAKTFFSPRIHQMNFISPKIPAIGILSANRYSRRCFLIVKLGRFAQSSKVLNLTIREYQFTTATKKKRGEF